MEESKQTDADVIRLTPIKERMLRQEIQRWGHIAFRWDIELRKGQYFEGPNGNAWKVVDAEGNIKRATKSIPHILIKETFDQMESFWAESSLIYCAASGEMINLNKRNQQELVLHNIRKKRHAEKKKQEEQNKPKKSIIATGHKRDPDEIDPFLITDSE